MTTMLQKQRQKQPNNARTGARPRFCSSGGAYFRRRGLRHFHDLLVFLPFLAVLLGGVRERSVVLRRTPGVAKC